MDYFLDEYDLFKHLYRRLSSKPKKNILAFLNYENTDCIKIRFQRNSTFPESKKGYTGGDRF